MRPPMLRKGLTEKGTVLLGLAIVVAILLPSILVGGPMTCKFSRQRDEATVEPVEIIKYKSLADLSFEERGVDAMIEQWNNVRFNELWPVQGINRKSERGGMQNLQVGLVLRKLDAARKAGRQFNHVCETGFFRGGSSLLWLMAFPNIKVHSFDLVANPEAVKWFRYRFGSVWNITLGDSKKTVAEFAAQNPGLCDLVLIDGAHHADFPYSDIKNFRPASHKRTIILSDDTYDLVNIEPDSPPSGPRENGSSLGWKKALDEAIIKRLPDSEPMCTLLGKSGPHYLGQCWGEYNFDETT